MATIISNLPQQIDYNIWQGDTWSPGTITATENDIAIDFTGWTAKVELRSAISGDVAVTLTSTPEAGITLTSLGVITMSLTAAQTATLLGDYKYDLQMTNPSAAVKTYTYGIISVTADTTA